MWPLVPISEGRKSVVNISLIHQWHEPTRTVPEPLLFVIRKKKYWRRRDARVIPWQPHPSGRNIPD